jgi:hypothetical protein
MPLIFSSSFFIDCPEFSLMTFDAPRLRRGSLFRKSADKEHFLRNHAVPLPECVKIDTAGEPSGVELHFVDSGGKGRIDK